MNRLLPLLLLSLLLAACAEKDPSNPLPADERPTIRRTAPAQPTVLAKPGEAVRLQYLIADNEWLSYWEIEALRVENVRLVDTVVAKGGRFVDTLLLKGDTLPRQLIHSEYLNGARFDRQFTYRTPDDAPPFSRVLLRAMAVDRKGQRDTAAFDVAVDIARVDTLAAYFRIFQYEGDTLYAKNSASPAKSVFNLVARDYPGLDNTAAQDIAESSAAGTPFAPRLTSPAGGGEASLVVLPPTAFNFDALTYATMRAAFYAYTPLDRTPTLQVGDVVLVQLAYKHASYRGYHHFAAVRVRSIVTAPDGNHYLLFDYKRSFDA